MLSASAVRINKLRVTRHHGDPLALRLRMDRILSATDFTPPGLPPTAIICIKHLRDPRPGLLDLAADSRLPAFAWEQAVRERVAELVAKAPRSPQARLAVDSECVVFIDMADLLASLASDWCEGLVTTRWWWRALLRNADASHELLALWQSAPQSIPAALERLGPRRIEFVRALSDAEANDLVQKVVRTFALTGLVSLLVPLSWGFAGTDHVATARDGPNDSTPAPLKAPAPWQRYVREVNTAGLSNEQQRFLGLSLMLLRSPATVRAKSFAREVENWQAFIASEDLVTATQTDRDRVASTGSPVQANAATREASPASSPAANVSHKTSGPRRDRGSNNAHASLVGSVEAEQIEWALRMAGSDLAKSDVPSVNDQDRARLSPPSSIEPVASALSPSTSPSLVETDRAAARDSVSPGSDETIAKPTITTEVAASEVRADIAVTESEPTLAGLADETGPRDFGEAIEEKVETHFGGLFYLINLGIYLGLYGDFTTPAEPGIDLNIWEFVALVGRELGGPQVESDPVWFLLARLAGREESFEFAEDESRLSRKHFTVADRDELETQNSKLETILSLLPDVRARLRLALGLKEDEDPGPLLICHFAKVRVTATHVDVAFDLAELPLAIRLAGLDRDPGWVPAAGRYIAFHFE